MGFTVRIRMSRAVRPGGLRPEGAGPNGVRAPAQHYLGPALIQRDRVPMPGLPLEGDRFVADGASPQRHLHLHAHLPRAAHRHGVLPGGAGSACERRRPRPLAAPLTEIP
jgi:hypothetical protein